MPRTKQLAVQNAAEIRAASRVSAAAAPKKIKVAVAAPAGEGGEGTEPDVPKIKHAHRWRPGTVSIREIRKYQKSTEMMIPKMPFKRLVREILQRESRKGIDRIQPKAVLALQEAAEAFLHGIFANSVELMDHANHTGVSLADFQLAERVSTKGQLYRHTMQ